jgi:TDG/mug DNA glycosylase family protein
VLILGSMPGAASLERGEYYAYERNAFWDIMGRLFDAGRDKSYAQRTRILKDNGVALWDVLDACVRPGSLDADIRDAEPNDFAAFLAKHRRIERIAFNGGAAQKFFRRHIGAPDGVELVRLPSTSPAHAALRFEQKLAEWRRALKR